MVMATLQGFVSSLFVYAAFCVPLALYGLFKGRSGEMAWFTGVAFFLMAVYITQVGKSRWRSRGYVGKCMTSHLPNLHHCTDYKRSPSIGCHLQLCTRARAPRATHRAAADASVLVIGGERVDQRARQDGAAHLPLPGGCRCLPTCQAAPCKPSPALSAYCTACPSTHGWHTAISRALNLTPTLNGCWHRQAAANQVSYRLSTGRPIMENLLCLAAFAVIAGIALRRQLRRMQATWAEALLAPKGAELRCGCNSAGWDMHAACCWCRKGLASSTGLGRAVGGQTASSSSAGALVCGAPRWPT